MIFEDLKLSNNLLEAIKRQNITKPTEIQKLAIPHIMQGKDVIGESATGSGKTLAFGCGIIEHTEQRKGIQALILAPTRELVEQITINLRKYSYDKQLKIANVYGGVSINPQIDQLRYAEIVVATPGRLLDHLQRRTINVSKVKLLVLDEVDRMLDMGFIRDVEKIIRLCPRERQTLFFSATISSSLRSLANRYMKDPVKVSVANQVDPSKLKQIYYDVDRNSKLSLLIHLLQGEESELVMVFCNTRRQTDFVDKNLRVNNIKSIAIHGGLTQNKRSNTLKMFDSGKIRVLCCTDVAARGLHIDNVSHVYNFEIPKNAKDYVHRIGRTARAGENGIAINLISDMDHENFSAVIREFSNFTIEKTQKPEFKKIFPVRSQRQHSHMGFHNRGRQGNRGFGPRRHHHSRR